MVSWLFKKMALIFLGNRLAACNKILKYSFDEPIFLGLDLTLYTHTDD